VLGKREEEGYAEGGEITVVEEDTAKRPLVNYV